MSLYDYHEKYLENLSNSSQKRELSMSDGICFSSNDYLGLANSDELRTSAINAIHNNIPIGSGGSRLLSGNHPEHIALENEASVFFGSQSTLFFANGYAANVGVISTLPKKDDIIFFDEYIHASSHDGMRLARCLSQSFRHNDSDDLADKLSRWRKQNPKSRIWILCETLYSMDGDIVPIDAFQALAIEYQAIMIIDEAHATGVFGSNASIKSGKGIAMHLDGMDNIIIVRTCGKALGCEGALLSLPHIAKDYLINRARHFIFSTAPSPLMASLIRRSLKIIDEQPEKREKLSHLCDYAAQKLTPLGAISHDTPILPLIIGDAQRTMNIAAALQAQGFYVRGIRPPTVPKGSSRLRICISLNIEKRDIDNLTYALKELL